MESVSGNQAFEGLLGEYRNKVFRLACSLLGDEARSRRCHPGHLPADLEGTTRLPGRVFDLYLDLLHCPQCLPDPPTAGGRASHLFMDDANAAQIPARPMAASDGDLRALIGQLPTKYRDVLVLFYLEERSYQQVSEALDLPMGTVKTFLHRAKKELALLMETQSKRKEEAIPWPALNSKI